MLLRLDQFHGSRPRRDPGLLGPFESQVADNCRLWSGVLDCWRKPTQILAVGTNSLIYSNDLTQTDVWPRDLLNGVTSNATTAPDGSTTADKILESASGGLHGVHQNVTKLAVAQDWAAAVSFKSSERTFGYIRLSDAVANTFTVIVDLTTGLITSEVIAGTLPKVATSVVAETNGFWRLNVIGTIGTASTVRIQYGPALNGTTVSYAGTLNSGVFVYGASLRQASTVGPYRETLDTARPSIDTIYLFRDQYWFVTSTPAFFTKGPVAGDTTEATYFTGGPATLPSYTYDPIAYAGANGRGDMPRQFYTLGLPAPASSPVAALAAAETGSVTNATNVIASTGTQTVASFNIASVTTDGFGVVAQCNFQTTIQTQTANNITVTMRIKRGTKVIAESERKINLALKTGVTETEVIEALVAGVDTPPPGTYTYTFEVVITLSSGTLTSTTYNHTGAKVRYQKVIVTTGSHPFQVGDFATFTGVVGFESLNRELLEVVATTGTTISVNLDVDETYTSGGTWKKDYTESEKQDTAWVLTFLTQVGNHQQEGPPSIASNIIAIGSGQPVSLTSLATAPPSDGGTYNVTGKRLYRSNVAPDGNASFQFLAELALATTSYQDSTRFDALGEELPSTEWVKPPADMKGMTAMHGGVLVGWSKNQVCFSEPYQPHAWPIRYRLAMNYDPNALAVFGSSVLVAQRGPPSVAIGTDPAQVRVEPIEAKQPCVSAKSLVDMGDYIVYAGDDGLVLVSSAEVQLVTRALFTKEEWRLINPASIIAGEYDSRYVGFYTTLTGEKRGFIFDPREPEASWTGLDFGATTAWTDPKTGDLYLVIDENIVKWDSHDTDRFPFRWRSRRYRLQRPFSPAYARVTAEQYPVEFNLFANTDPADQALQEVTNLTVLDSEPFTLDGSYLTNLLEVELRGSARVTSVAIATSMAELQQG